MLKIAYFDCFAGAGGDMIVAALLSAGGDLEALRAELAKLRLAGYSVRTEPVRRGGLAGLRFVVDVPEQQHHYRHLGDIQQMITTAGLAPRAQELALAAFNRLGQAEAKVHGTGLQEVHFHEVGAVDSIVDIVSAAILIDQMGIEAAYCSPIPLGAGWIKSEHGMLPVPAPATAELLRGVPAASPPSGIEWSGEMTTPTAAAVLTTLVQMSPGAAGGDVERTVGTGTDSVPVAPKTTVALGFGPMPAMQIDAVGYGAGTREGGPLPNLLRVVIGQLTAEGSADAVVELSANLDDCTGQVLGWAMEKLLAAGALDAWATPIYMKKSRPAWLLSALCSPADADKCEAIIFAETPSLGVRRRVCTRSKLARRHDTVETPYGPVRVKVSGRSGTADLTATPEFADCASAATAHDVSVREVIAAATAAWRAGHSLEPK